MSNPRMVNPNVTTAPSTKTSPRSDQRSSFGPSLANDRAIRPAPHRAIRTEIARGTMPAPNAASVPTSFSREPKKPIEGEGQKECARRHVFPAT